MAHRSEASAARVATDTPAKRGGDVERGLTIGQVSQRMGIPAKTLRYEDTALLRECGAPAATNATGEPVSAL